MAQTQFYIAYLVFLCSYTNADQFKRKFPELSVQFQNELTMLIAVIEVKPKYSIDKLLPAEFFIEHTGDLDSPLHRNITNDIGRSILLNTHKFLKAKEVEMQTESQESIPAEVKLNNTNYWLVGI